MKGMAWALISLVLAGVIGTVACSVNRLPTEEDAAKAYEHNLKVDRMTDYKKLLSIKKTDGQKSVLLGVPSYTLFYEARVEYIRPIGQYQAGQTAVEHNSLVFQKTENGWRGPDGETYISH